MYVSTVSEDVTISPDKQVCPHFSGNFFSHALCSHCNSHIGYFIEEITDVEEEVEETPEVVEYEEEDIIELLNIHPDGIEMQLKETFLSQSEPTITIGYWSYKYIHRISVQQYHEKVKGNPNDNSLQWSLGQLDELRSGTYGVDTSTQIPIPYYSYFYTNGQMCDETKSPRETEVRFEPCDNKQVYVYFVVDIDCNHSIC